MVEQLSIGGVDIPLGSQMTLELPLPNLYTHTRVALPIRVMRGSRNGARLLISAALHGDEINGVEIIRRLLAMPQIRRLHGTLIAVPVVNVYGFLSHSRYLPDRRDLNRSFPGSESGSLTARLARLFLDEVVAKATHGIDLHTGALHRANLPHIRAHLADPQVEPLARAFGAPVILDSPPPEGSLRQAAMARQLPYLLYEGGEALRFDELAIRAGVRGILSVMRALEMLPPTRERSPHPDPVIARSSGWVRAPQSGILRAALPLGARVEKDAPLAVISDPFGERETPVLARHAGIVLGRTHLPLVNEGEALFHVARFQAPGAVEERLESYQDELADMRELGDPFNPAFSPETL
ncbi:MAG TPA: succinylglutamate desuccinylase/aspartoacylase family protein [Candidatus Competibacteraceae bacterium]|nr:succinylglutamate desuccinylase/aspartoacylase family protein [Candidatus Competibacteraceae bacterium]